MSGPSTAASAAGPGFLPARIPAAWFGMVLGLGGIANGWRVATRIWAVPEVVADVAALIAFAVWAGLAALHAAKWIGARAAARGEACDPIGGGFVGLVPFATMIAGLAMVAVVAPIGRVMLIAGVIGQIGYGSWFLARIVRGGRAVEATTPVLYLPTVGGGFVAAMALATLGAGDAAKLCFGAGLVSWLVLEAVVVRRLVEGPSLAPPLRPSFGILLAAPAVGCLAELAVTSGPPDLAAFGLFGYGLLQALMLVWTVRWTTEQPFAANWWGFSFGVAALPLAGLRLVERGAAGFVEAAAPLLFAAGNAIVLALVVATVRLAVAGRLLPPPPAAKS